MINISSSDPMVPKVFRISKLRKETYDTFTLELASKEQKFRFESGQFNMLYVFGIGEIPISISGNPNKPGPILHTTRAVGTVTKAMSQLRVGDHLGVRGPFGSNWPVNQAIGNDIMMITGGIGLAPLRPAMYEVLARRGRFGRVTLLYGARTPEDILYQKEVMAWRSQFDLDIHVTVDRATGRWRGNVGVVTKLIPKAPFDPYNTTVFICGPEVMMRLSIAELKRQGVPDESIYISMERNMKCALGFCGHCQFGPYFVCKDGPVFRYDKIRDLMQVREL